MRKGAIAWGVAAALALGGVGCKGTSAPPARSDPPVAAQPKRPAAPAAPSETPVGPKVAATAPAAPAVPAGQGELLNQVERKTGRDYKLYLPPEYKADRQCPMVVALAGMQPFDSAPMQVRRWQEAANRLGWMVLAPAVAGSRLGAEADREKLAEDVKAVNAVLAEVFGKWSIDPRRVSIAGFDTSATLAVACALDRPGRFAAAAIYRPYFDPARLAAWPTGKQKGLPVLVAWNPTDPPRVLADVPVLVDWLTRAGWTVEKVSPLASDRDTAPAAKFFEAAFPLK